jgi:hypothetical protein
MPATITARTARLARQYMKEGRMDSDPERILKQAAKVTGLKHHGVETLTCGRRDTEYTYLNMGDPYIATVAWNESRQGFSALEGGWGPVVERADRYKCGYCGERPHRPGKTMCAQCAEWED